MKYIIFLLFTIYSFSQEEVKLPIDPITNCELRYYYYSNMEMYYDFKTKTYIYIKNGVITETKTKPVIGYSLYNNKFVRIRDYDDNDILNCLEKHKRLYPYVSSKKRNKL